jgi:hypothetical protein
VANVDDAGLFGVRASDQKSSWLAAFVVPPASCWSKFVLVVAVAWLQRKNQKSKEAQKNVVGVKMCLLQRTYIPDALAQA